MPAPASDAPAPTTKPVVALAGATGFVGSALLEALRPHYRIRALTRSTARTAAAAAQPEPDIEWRRCDLFSLLDLEQALAGADYAIYLVHSMLPGSRLTQASFADLDLLIADNFARAARHARLKHIVYLGGLLPAEGPLSPHLASRLEVEQTLASGRAPVTALRAGLIVGPGGSSLRILVNLVRRLPVMLLPRWTRTLTHPIAVADVVRAVELTLGRPDLFTGPFDIGGPEIMTYREMMTRSARLLRRRRWLINVPLLSPRFSKLWVTLFGGSTRALVGPLVESLRHPMVASPNPLLQRLQPAAVGFDEALRRSIDEHDRLRPNPRLASQPGDNAAIRAARRVRSVQRLPLPPHLDAAQVATAFYRWAPRFVGPWLRCDVDNQGRCSFRVRLTGLLLLELTHSAARSTSDRQLFYVTGGVLARTANNRKARLEFREMLDRRCLLAAIHDFSPTLPWYLYNLSQAPVHLAVMRAFGRHLGRIARDSGAARQSRFSS